MSLIDLVIATTAVCYLGFGNGLVWWESIGIKQYTLEYIYINHNGKIE